MVGRRFLALAAALALAAEGRAAPRDLFLEAEVEPRQVYVQSQAVYRLRLYQAVDVRELNITGPSAALADFLPIGSGRVYEAARDGRRYRVHERSYAVFPFASGPLAIAGARAAGRVPAPASAAADGRRPVTLDAAPLTLSVLPLPGAGNGLPARALSLSESWPPAAASLGAAQRRRIRIEAAGVEAGLLPEVRLDIPGMAVTPAPPRLENRFRGEVNVAVREQDFTLVPLRGGEVAVPELRVDWWNVAAGAAASAVLPARRVVVAAGATPAAPVPGPASSPPSSTAAVVAPGLATAAAAPHPAWLLLAAGLAGGAAGLAWRRRAGWLKVRRLRLACRSGRAGAARDELLAWAAVRWPDAPPPTLVALAGRLSDPAARRALAELDRSLYGPASGAWDGKALAALARRIQG